MQIIYLSSKRNCLHRTLLIIQILKQRLKLLLSIKRTTKQKYFSITYRINPTTMKKLFFLVILASYANVFSSDLYVSFEGTGASNTVDEVFVQNLTQNISMVLPGSAVLNLTDNPNAIESVNKNDESIWVASNLGLGNNTVSFFSKKSGTTQISVFGIDGKKIIGSNNNLPEGRNSFQMNLPKGAYIIQVIGNGYKYATKLISKTNTMGGSSLAFSGNEKPRMYQAAKTKMTSDTINMLYKYTDKMLYRAKSGIYTTVATSSQGLNWNSRIVSFNFVSCQDADLNNYGTVTIGNQTWMVENLRTTKYQNGVSITGFTGDWSKLTTGAQCNYNNSSSYASKYGRLYNWLAATYPGKVAPFGWHVPSDDEWFTLSDYLTSTNLTGGSLKDIGTTDWSNDNIGATNITGFTALPSGMRFSDGTFFDLGKAGIWWSTTPINTESAYGRSLSYNDDALADLIGGLSDGYSIRCIKDKSIPTVENSAANSITEFSADVPFRIISVGGTQITSAGICWDTLPSPTINKLRTNAPSTLFVNNTHRLTGLKAHTTYYAKAYATNSVGTAYGSEISFKTAAFDQEKTFLKIYSTLGLTGNLQPAGDPDVLGVDEGHTSFVRSIWNMNELTTDEAICSWGDPEIPELNLNQFTSTNIQIEALYKRLYFDISLCNNFLAETKDKKDDQSLKQCAEARFIRALNYYYLLDMYGNVPFSENYFAFNQSQISRSSLYSYIEKELTECEANMYDPLQSPYGRADKAANWLIKSRLYLNAEIYTGIPNWSEAANYSKKVMDSGYKLCPTYRQLFMADNDGYGGVNKARQEIILPIVADGITAQSWGTSTFLIASTHTSGMIPWGFTEGWAGNRARSTLVKKFFPSGTSFFSNSADLTTAISASAKDARALFDKLSVSQGLTITAVGIFKQGYQVIKFSNLRADGGPSNSTHYADTDVPFLRMAEAYLTYAEAILRISSANILEAVATVNQLRTRAGATLFTTLDATTILDEKAREFFFEGQRRTDLIRHGKYGGETSYTWDWKNGVAAGSNFSTIYNVFPIPSSELNSNPNIYQNAGY